MTREEFYLEAVIAAMNGLLCASGDYKDELINDPLQRVSDAAHDYAQSLTNKVYGPDIEWPKDRIL